MTSTTSIENIFDNLRFPLLFSVYNLDKQRGLVCQAGIMEANQIDA